MVFASTRVSFTMNRRYCCSGYDIELSQWQEGIHEVMAGTKKHAGMKSVIEGIELLAFPVTHTVCKTFYSPFSYKHP